MPRIHNGQGVDNDIPAKKASASGSNKEMPKDEVWPAPPPKETHINWVVGGHRKRMLKAIIDGLNETPGGSI